MKRRWVKVLTIVVVILAGLFVALDRIAVHFAEKEAVALVQEKYGYGASSTDGRTEVSIHGFPFLTQAADMRLDHVTLSAGNFSVNTTVNAQGDHLNIRALDLELRDLTASSLSARSAGANLVTGRVVIGYEDLSGVVSRLLAKGGGLTVAPADQAQNNQTQSGTAQNGGSGEEARLKVSGTWDGRALNTPASISVAADEFQFRAPEISPEPYTWRIPLPQNIDITGSRATPEGLELELTGHQVVLGG
ncbi:DUF2993 domain-containing protein [Streptomyces sp. NPDC090025]|uniref:LmeA family phospholipid-binding protein n=1 Tax=Streptomyces sp. NPDC090025 TaxID=3365922 RepID=UPI003834CAE1